MGYDVEEARLEVAALAAQIEARLTELEGQEGGATGGPYQPLDSDLTAIAELTTTPYGRGLLTVADQGALKSALSLTKGDVGLGNVDNTDDASKPVSTATQTALDAKQPLDADLTTLAGLTANTDNVIQSVSGAWASRTPAQLKATLGLVKGDVGLGGVDNTSDAAKPVSTATQTALNAKAPLVSPAFTTSATLDGQALVKTDDARLTNARTPTAHTHPASELTATGTRDATTFLRGDNTWAAPSAAPSGAKAIPFEVALLVAGATAITPAAAAATVNTELLATVKPTRRIIDLSNATQVRLVGMVLANGNVAGLTYKLGYMTTNVATWTHTTIGTSEVQVAVGTGTVGTLRDSGWIDLAAGAKVANVVIACAVGGVTVGTTPATVGSLTAFFR